MALNFVSRTAQQVKNTLGLVKIDSRQMDQKVTFFRNPSLDRLDSYFEDRAYADLMDWQEAIELSASSSTDFIPIRKRAPHLRFNLAKVLCSRVASKLVGSRQFPKLLVENDPETQEYFRFILKASRLRASFVEPMKRILCSGSGLVRYFVENGQFATQFFLAKHVRPELDEAGNIVSARIRFIFDDVNDRDDLGRPKKKWFQLDLGQNEEIIYDNPEFEPGSEPLFQIVETIEHNSGFVRAEWFKTDMGEKTDGFSIIEDVLNLVDEINYSLSQSSQTLGYNLDPQLVVKGMNMEELEQLIRSSSKAWNIGKEGEAKFIESNLNSIERAEEHRNKIRTLIMDVTRVLLMDPEKIAGHAQSGKALEVLHGPLVELIDELRPAIGQGISRLVSKMAVTNLLITASGETAPVTIPSGFQPSTLEAELSWPPIFPVTMEDLQKKVSVASSAANARLISRETLTRWLAKDFDVEDIELEIQKIEAQPILNPFGAF